MPFYFCLNQNIKETITFKSQTLKNPRKSEKIQVKQKKVFFCKNCKIYLFSSVDYGKHLSGHGVHEAMLKCENLVADQKCEYPIDHKLQKPKLHGADQKQAPFVITSVRRLDSAEAKEMFINDQKKKKKKMVKNCIVNF